ncbi:MAG: hypothetical protein IJZ80_09055 [Clostridia bacterium]|nr:hypothetical protein [Clostridia bacterium]
MKRYVCFLGALLLLLSLLCLPVAGETIPDEVVFDRAELLNDAEICAVKEAVFDAWEASDCAFYVATHKVSAYSATRYKYTGEDFLREHGLSSKHDIVVLIVTLDQGVYYYDYYTYGKAYSRISQKEVDYILDHDDVYDNIKGGNLPVGISSAMSLSAKAYEGRVGVSYVIIVTVSLIIALIIGIIACVSVNASYKMKKKSVDYPLDKFAKLNLTGQSDVFTGSFVTKRVIQTNSGSRGGGSSHGGGGGHRGGR